MHAHLSTATSCSLKPPTRHNEVSELVATIDPLSPLEEPDEPSDLDNLVRPFADDDSHWDAFIPDDDEFDPLPEPGDFWTTQD